MGSRVSGLGYRVSESRVQVGLVGTENLKLNFGLFLVLQFEGQLHQGELGLCVMYLMHVAELNNYASWLRVHGFGYGV